MNFKEWLINEIGNILNQDTSTLQLSRISDGYEFKFQISGLYYRVYFKHYNGDFFGENIPAWSIGFKGPNEYASTGLAGTSANAVYANLLLAVKKLLEIEEVEALTWSAYEPKMDIVYRRFFKQYLSKDFMQISSNLYVRKNYLRDIIQKQNPDYQRLMYKKIMDSQRDYVYSIKATQQKKQKTRQQMLRAKESIGKIVPYRDYYSDDIELAYIMSYNHEYNEVDVLAMYEGRMDKRTYGVRNFLFDQPVSEGELDKFLRAIAIKSNSTPWFRDYVFESEPLKKMLDERNLKY